MSRGSRPEGTSIFFNNVPIGITERQLRTYFESTGHIIGLRLIQPQLGKDSQFGFVDYLDPSSASDAVAQLDGLELGGKRLKVSLASSGRKRDRQDRRGGDAPAAAAPTDEDGAPVNTGPPFALPRGYQNPILGHDNPIDACLVRLPQVEVYEAVEQLRLLALERPTEAALLLEAYPQLRVAVVTILQQAGKLAMGPLPPSALISLAERNELNNAAAAAAASSTAAAAPAPSAPEMDEETRRMVEQILEKLPPEKVEKLLTMSDADVVKIPDLNQRRQVMMLRQHLLPLLNEAK